MENKRTFKVLLIFISVYMVLSWIIVSGSFANGEFASKGFNQIGLLDFFSAPVQLFNYFVVTVTKNIDGYVNQVSYGNIIIAFICIGIFYGVINKTGVYSRLIEDIKNKVKPKKDLFLIIISCMYCIFSALTGLNLIMFLFFPAISAILSKLKYNKKIIFIATIGSMLLGGLGSILNPTINGLNKVMFGLRLDNNIATRIIYLVMLLIVLIAYLLLSKNKEVDVEEKIPFIKEEIKKKNIKGKKVKKQKSYWPIIITAGVVSFILFACMYNWYYTFDSTVITDAYNKVMSSNISNYTFMKNIFGMSESFGYWTGFTMSVLLLVASLIIGFMYSLKLEEILEGAKDGVIEMIPTSFYSIISLTIIVLSLSNNNSFLYSIINNIFKIKNLGVGVLSSAFIHNFFINDYFALTSSLSAPLTTLYGTEKIGVTLFTAQIGHGLASFVTPFNVFLIAGLSFLKISYTDWLKYIWKFLIIIFTLSLIVLFITLSVV